MAPRDILAMTAMLRGARRPASRALVACSRAVEMLEMDMELDARTRPAPQAAA